MKLIFYGVLSIYLLVAFSHLLLWPFNQEMYSGFKKTHQEVKTVQIDELKELRLRMEAQSRSDLNRYKWLDKRRGYAEIPIDRAIDYYLRRHHP